MKKTTRKPTPDGLLAKAVRRAKEDLKKLDQKQEKAVVSSKQLIKAPFG